MFFVLRYLELYPVQLLIAGIFFGRRLSNRDFRRKGKRDISSRGGYADQSGTAYAFRRLFCWIEAVLFSIPMIGVYDSGMRNAVTTGSVLWDRAVLLLPVFYIMVVLWICYDCKFLDAAYYTVTAAAAQNLVYNLYWVLISYLHVQEGTVASILVSIPVMASVYTVVYLVFSRKLREYVEYSFARTRLLSTAAIILLFIIFLNLRIEDTSQQYHVYGAYILGDIFCLFLLFGIFYESGLEQKYLIMEQLLYAEQKKQQMTKENIELINRKCHDLKHQISALRVIGDSKEKEAYIKEIEKAAVFYESSAKTGNQMLDLLLMDKLLYCEKYKIRLSCIAEGEKLDFLDTMDLYSLFGNALDNAIESVVQEEDEKKRIISFKVASHGQILSIHFENYIGHELEFADGMPVTTKEDKQYHGFGMMSIRYIVEKYGGTLQVSAANHLFQMNILMPIPETESRISVF